MDKLYIPDFKAYDLTPHIPKGGKHDFECDLCGHHWSASNIFDIRARINRLGSKQACPVCNRKEGSERSGNARKDDNSKVDRELYQIGLKLLEPYVSAREKTTIQCLCCGAIHKDTTVLTRKQGASKNGTVGCRQCGRADVERFKAKLIEQPSPVAQDHDSGSIDIVAINALEVTNKFKFTKHPINEQERVQVICGVCTGKFHTCVEEQHAGGGKCPHCELDRINAAKSESVIVHLKSIGCNIKSTTNRGVHVTTDADGFTRQTVFVPFDRADYMTSLTDIFTVVVRDKSDQIEKVKKQGYTVVGEYVGYRDRLQLVCDTCGHGNHERWMTSHHAVDQSIRKGATGCPVCSRRKVEDDRRNTAIEKATEREHQEMIAEQEYHKYRDLVTELMLKSGINPKIAIGFKVTPRYCFVNSIPAEMCADRSNLGGKNMNWDLYDDSRGEWGDDMMKLDELYIKLHPTTHLLQFIANHNFIDSQFVDGVFVDLIDTDSKVAIKFIDDNYYMSATDTKINKMEREWNTISRSHTPLFININDWSGKPRMIAQAVKAVINHPSCIHVKANQCSVVEITTNEAIQFVEHHTINDHTINDADKCYATVVNDKVIAVVTCNTTQPTIQLTNLTTNRTYKGAILSKLINTIIHQHDPEKLVITTSNQIDVKLLNKLGFNEVERIPTTESIGNMVVRKLPSVRMECDLIV